MQTDSEVVNDAESREFITTEQMKVYGMLKFPKDFMDIGEKTFEHVYENRTEWVKFSSKWETATGVFQAWYLYVKLRMSIDKNKHDKSPDGKSNGDTDVPYYTISGDDADRGANV